MHVSKFISIAQLRIGVEMRYAVVYQKKYFSSKTWWLAFWTTLNITSSSQFDSR